MSLTTTMGMELTYVPAAVQVAINRGAKFKPCEAEHNGETQLIKGYVSLLNSLVQAKKIPVYSGAHHDPGVVEIATKPYAKLSTLLSVARRIGREATALGLSPKEVYSGGGGCHIHTGVIGATQDERAAYIKRMFVFMAQYPAFAWATSSTGDDINATPIPRQLIMGGTETDTQDTLIELENSFLMYQADIIRNTNALHMADSWAYDSDKRYHALNHERYTKNLNKIRRKLAAARARAKVATSKTPTVIPLETVTFDGGKTYVIRSTYYGKQGTIEFRSFEMGSEAKLKRNIILANAICRYVEKQTYTTFDASTIMDAKQMHAMKWSEAKAQWLGLLVKLGLNPNEYREDTAQLAIRWRAYRPSLGEDYSQGSNPTGVKPDNYHETGESWVIRNRRETANRATNHAVTRHARMLDKRSQRQATRFLREQQRINLEAAAKAAKEERKAVRLALQVQASSVTTEAAIEACYECAVPDEAECVEAQSVAQSVVDDEEETFMEAFDTPVWAAA